MLHGIEAQLAEAELEAFHLFEVLLSRVFCQDDFEHNVEPLHEDAVGHTGEHVEENAQDETSAIRPDVAQQLCIRLLGECKGLSRVEIGEVFAADFVLVWLGHLD